MSLGVKSLWRAQSCAIRVKKLSLIPRESRSLLPFHLPNTRRWLSARAGDTTQSETETESARFRKIGLAKKQSATVENEHTTAGEKLLGTSNSSYRRAVLKRIIRKRWELGPKDSALVKPPTRYPSKYESLRSLRKHRKSAARQYLHDHIREAASKPLNDWRSTLDFLLRHTAELDNVFKFKVIIGSGAAAEARTVLSGMDTNLRQIRRRNQSVIRIEETSPQDGALILSVAGSELAIRKSLLEITREVGKLTAVKIIDPAVKLLLSDIWQATGAQRPVLRLLGDRETALDNQTMTIHKHAVDNQTTVLHRDAVEPNLVTRPLKYEGYTLTRRADDITRPAHWTKLSFERYVAALVHARLPTHLARSLYPEAPDHQQTVASLLVDVFTSDHSRDAISMHALNMALKFLQSRGTTLRQAARTIFHQAELLDLKMDSETYNIFLVGASRAGDLDGFNSILRVMVRKGYPPQTYAWLAFLDMMQAPTVRHYILQRMRAKGLSRLQSVYGVMGREKALEDLKKHGQLASFDIQSYLVEHEKTYGTWWLNTITLNKMLDVLGSQGELAACNKLLDAIHTNGRTTPDICTLNTIITHARKIPQKMAAMQTIFSRWPRLRPDDITFHQLFRVAWKQRLPNMLRVIWRYAILARSTSSKMNRSLTNLLRDEEDLSAQRALLKAWEDVIFGQVELDEARRGAGANGPNATQMMLDYLERAQGMKPTVSLPFKLQEAYETDMKIHKLIREGAVMSTSVRKAHTVDIPLMQDAKLQLEAGVSVRS